MLRFVHPAAAALAIASLAASVPMPLNVAFAQAAQQAAPQGTKVEPAMKQIALTEKQIQGVLAAQKDIDAASDQLPDDPNATPDSKVIATLDAVAKKYGFASYEDYNTVIDNISLVIGGFDPQTKKYVGAEAVLKQQIAAVQADNKIPSKDKKQMLDEMDAALKMPAPTIENKGNIDLVAKYYDKLVDVLSQESDD